MIPGFATPEGTAAYAARHGGLHEHFWCNAFDLSLGSFGIGTYLGNADDSTDAKYAAAVKRALELGVNIVDTAINYRFQRSERAVGKVLAELIGGGAIAREEILVCTKGGYLSGEGRMPTEEWVQKTFIDTGIVSPEDIVGGSHCMTPAYLKDQIERSRRNLGLETIDVYYLHNPETQVGELGDDAFYPAVTDAFRALEEAVAEGSIRTYGTATWDAYRVPDSSPSYLSLERIAQCAVEAGGPEHHFRFIQLPLNFGMPEACREAVQTWNGEPATALQVAYEIGAAVLTSVPLLQGRLLGRFSPELKAKFPGLETDAQRCLQFARSTPGVCAPLCGMKDPKHVDENFRISSVPTLSEDEFNSFFADA